MNRVPSWGVVKIKRKKLFIWGIVVLIFVYLFSSLAFLQFICLFFLFILAGSRFYTEYLVRKISIYRMDMELRVFRHEWVRVELRVENRGLLPAFMLTAGDLPGNLQVFKMRKTSCTLFWRSWTLLNWEGLCADRGVFSIGPAVIRGADPLGLFPFHLTAAETTQLFVYPVVRSISLKNRGGIPLGNLSSVNPLFEDITRRRSLRPYQPGDEKRRINWKASAHVSNLQSSGLQYSYLQYSYLQYGGLLVDEYEATASYPLMIFLNMDQDEYPRKNQKVFMERAIEAAAALCLKASRERQELGIIIYLPCQESGITVIAPSAFTLIPILERLAAVNWTKPASSVHSSNNYNVAYNTAAVMLDQGKRLSYGTKYLYIGADLGDEAYINLNLLKKHHLSLEYLIIDERSLPSLVPGNSPRHQMKESGYAII